MSKLTDKIEALMTQAQQAERPGQTNAPMGDIWPALADILADVRELEQQATAWTTQQRYVAIARQAKREAYEHALELTEDTSRAACAAVQEVVAVLHAAINALNTEGGDNE